MPDPITPTLPDPQASVDAALGSLSPTPVAPAPVMNAPMGDETPLAFAAPTLNALPTTPAPTPAPVMPSTPLSPIAPEVPKLEPMPSVGSSYLPPVPPAPISTPPVEDKPKKKSKVMLVVIGIFAMLGVLGVGGYFAYQQYVTQNTIAIVDYGDEASCVNNCDGNHKLIWTTRKGVTGCYWSTKLCEATTPPPGDTFDPNASKSNCNAATHGIWCESVDSLNQPYSFCIDSRIQKGCNQYAVERGFTITYGSTPNTSPDATHKYKCVCGSGTFYFDKSGICNSNSVTLDPSGKSTDPNFDVSKTVDPSYYDKWGLCGIVDNKNNAGDVANFTDYGSCFTCTDKNCSITGTAAGCNKCTTIRYECPEQVTGRSCTKNPDAASLSSTSKGKCGTVEQIDVMCDGHYLNSRTILNGACETNTVVESHKACNTTTKVCETVTGPGADTCATDANCVTAAPVLACTGLTNTPAAPVIGQTVTFTCAGTITPTGAATLSYKFKYSLNDGADQLLANKTNTTAELAITACGTYSVQCKVCATIAGVLKCDPTWTGAIQ